MQQGAPLPPLYLAGGPPLMGQAPASPELGRPTLCTPLLKAPRSPLALAELQSLNCEARDSKSSSPDLIFWM